MHDAARYFVASVVAGSRYERAVEVGGRYINGTVRDLVDAGSYTVVDLKDGPGVDVVADCRDWKPAKPVDLVVCCEVLEHADDPAGVVAACIGYLAPGGRLIVTCAGPGRPEHSAVDGGPLRGGEHYANVDPADLEAWLDGLVDVEVLERVDVHDLHATGVRPAKPGK